MKLKKALSAVVAGCILAVSTLTSVPASADFARVSVHDPSIVKFEEGGYYIIGSHLGAGRSSDMQNWYSAGNSHLGSTRSTFFNNIYADLAIPEKWSNTTSGYNLAGNMWAPDIIYNKEMGKYCMYLSVNGQVWNSSIVLCTSDKIDGPYKYEGTIVYSGFTNNAVNNVKDTDVPKVLGNNPDINRYLSNGSWNASYGTNAIDPAVFYDEEGKLLMIYGSWFGGLYMLELDGGKTEAGANIRQWSKNGESNQEWRIISEENGYCRIVSMSDESMCIAVSGNDATDGLNVELQKYSGSDNQLWKLIQNGSHYAIVSKVWGDANCDGSVKLIAITQKDCRRNPAVFLLLLKKKNGFLKKEAVKNL